MVKVKNIKKYKKRIIQLILLSVETAKNGNIELSRLYVKLAVLYSRKLRIKIPLEYKRMFCRKCFTPLIPGISERRRIKNKVLVRTCLYCGWVRRYKLRYKTTNKENKS